MSDLSESTAGGPAGVPRAVQLAVDAVVAAVLGMLLTISADSPIAKHAVSAPKAVTITIALISACVVATRRLAPLCSLAVGAVAALSSYLLGFERDEFLTVALVLYTVASTRPPRRSAAALTATGTATLAVFFIAPPPLSDSTATVPAWEIAAVGLTVAAVEAAGWAVGVAVHRQRSYLEAVRIQAAQEVRAQQELAARAAAEERLRIARELHDIVAHAMSVITVQAGVARYILDERPEQTGQALEAIESTGRQALRDMRQLLSVLRQDDECTPHAPTPRLENLCELISRTDAAGTAVELSVRGDPRRLPDGVELSAYRIVQEALTNVVKHAATDHARVVLDYEPDQLAVEVVDDGIGAAADTGTERAERARRIADAAVPGGGHGLVGMRERAAMHGGTLEAGPLPVRGYRVAARLPLPVRNTSRPTQNAHQTQQQRDREHSLATMP